MFSVGDKVRIKDDYSEFDCKFQEDNRIGFVSFVEEGRYMTFYSSEWDRVGVGHSGWGDQEFYISRKGHWHISKEHLEHIIPPPDISEFL